MKTIYFNPIRIIALLFLFTGSVAVAQVGIGIEDPDASSILDLTSTTSGLLIPRMTAVQRDAITTPAEGLQIYNTTNKSLDIYIGGAWKSFLSDSSPNASLSNLVYVYSLSDLPTPTGSNIQLDGNKMYIFSGIVDIGSNYITMGGAGLSGVDPQKDGVMSSATGGVIRSTGTSVFMENFTVIPTAGPAYALSGTASTFCNIFAGSSVIGHSVGEISGFKAITLLTNYWNVSDGVKVTGDVGKFTLSYCFIDGAVSGSGVEFLAGLTIDDIDIANSYFDYTGATGITVNGSATVDRARMTSNMFRGVGTPLVGVDSYSPGWSMSQNTNIPNSRAFGFMYFNFNSTATSLPTAYPDFYKVAGTTTTINAERFTATNNRLTYNGVDPIVGKVSIIISANSPGNNTTFSIGLGKNSTALVEPISSVSSNTNRQSFQITLQTEVDLVTGDYLEVFLASGTSTNSLIVDELQFRVED